MDILIKEIFEFLIQDCESWACTGWIEPSIDLVTCERCKKAHKLLEKYPELKSYADSYNDKKEKENRLESQSYMGIGSWIKGWKKDRCKYVIFDFGTSLFPILFPSPLGHDEIVKIMASLRPRIRTISAGFVTVKIDNNILADKIKCYGKGIINPYRDNKTEVYSLENDNRLVADILTEEKE
jgi:hypothetical protein